MIKDKKKAYMKNYVTKNYQRFWLRQVKVYGYANYHKNMVSLIMSIGRRLNGTKMLECAIGTGYPFAMEFSRRRWNVYGIDIAYDLIKECYYNAKKAGLDIHSHVGDVEALPYRENIFDLVYCLQSTWYFPDMRQAVAEMVRVTKPGSYIVFDIMNLLSPKIFLKWLAMWLSWLLALPKMLAKRVLKGISIRMQMWEMVPTVPAILHRILGCYNINYTTTVFGTQDIDNLAPVDWFHHRLVYICQKQQYRGN